MPTTYDFKVFFDNAPDGVFIADEKGKYLLANHAACKITGYSKEELENMTIGDITPDDGKEACVNHFQKLLKEGRSVGEVSFSK